MSGMVLHHVFFVAAVRLPLYVRGGLLVDPRRKGRVAANALILLEGIALEVR